jgi:predicted ArsR family transcriptional regulator
MLNLMALRLGGVGWLSRRQERRLLRLAQERGGRLTTPDVALALKLTLPEAKAALDSLVLSGYAGYTIETDGHFVYHLLEPHLWAEGPSRRRRPGLREIERQLVQLALQRGGRLTTAEVVAHLPLTLDEAKAKLDELSAAGHIGYEVEEDGRITYRLTEAVPLDGEVSTPAVTVERRL